MTIPLFDGFCSQNPIQIVRPQHLVNRNFSFVLSSLTYIHLICIKHYHASKKFYQLYLLFKGFFPFEVEMQLPTYTAE